MAVSAVEAGEVQTEDRRYCARSTGMFEKRPESAIGIGVR